MRCLPLTQSILLAAISVLPVAAITSLPASCGQNLFVNPSFENGATAVPGWAYEFTPGESTDQHSDGAKSMTILTSPSANNFGQTVYGLDATQLYDITIDYKAIVNPSAATGFTCYISFYLSIPQGSVYQTGALKFTADGNDKGWNTLRSPGMRLPYPDGVFIGFNVYCMAPAGSSITGAGTLYFDNAIIAVPCPVSSTTDISTPSAPVSTPSTASLSSTPTPVNSSTSDQLASITPSDPSTTPSSSTLGTDAVTPTVTTPGSSTTTPAATPTTLSTLTTPISSTESPVSDSNATTSTPTDLASAPTPRPSRRPCRSRRMRRSELVSEMEI
ncbi:unnamed protein product [Clonostachys rhizophaga]|uniref:CBM-cenC domain-containing protein n=1 Tax=Clonostachys rhizophaga TaxID=160324 RepID=A0A9N9VRZ0_9HYPO|nr:unnamed protein product [Clonostachys rhizophaga]